MPSQSMPCSSCGKMMGSSHSSLPEGKARCHACRRMARETAIAICPWCWQLFNPRARGTKLKKCCSRACAWASAGEQQRVRAPNDQHQERCERAKNAPGLSSTQRSQLLQRWKRQGETCAYCDALATTVDHVVPLVRGGTNYEGNLVPCCRPCNGRKQSRFIIEWRMGKRASRMGRALAWQNRVRPVKVVKIKPPKPTHPCPVCAMSTTCKVYCSKDCRVEWYARAVRDKYRADHGLTVDPSRPTRPTKRGKTVQFLISA